MAGVEVRIMATPEEFDLLRECVEMTEALQRAKPEERAEIAKRYLRNMSPSDVQRLAGYLATGKRQGR